MRCLLAVLVLFGFAAACKGDPAKCEKAARNYFTLVFWEKAEADIAAAPPEKRDELRKDLQAKFSVELEHNIDVVVSKCMSANNDDDVACLIDARTAKRAKECLTRPQ